MNSVMLRGKVNYLDKGKKFFLLTLKKRNISCSFPCRYFFDDLSIEKGDIITIEGKLFEKDRRVTITVDKIYKQNV